MITYQQMLTMDCCVKAIPAVERLGQNFRCPECNRLWVAVKRNLSLNPLFDFDTTISIVWKWQEDRLWAETWKGKNAACQIG